MRPAILFPLFAEIHTLPGIGPRLEKLIGQLVGPRLVDLAFDLPVGVIDRSYRPKLSAAEPGRIITALVRVEGHYPGRNKSQPYKVRCIDDTGAIDLVYFHPKADYLNKLLPVGELRFISGKVESFQDRLQMPHPDYVLSEAQLKAGDMPEHEPVYPLTAGLSGKVLGKAIRGALTKVPELPEWQDREFKRQHGWPAFHTALSEAHSPKTVADLEPGTDVRQRLAYDEMLAGQLALALIRRKMRAVAGREIKGDGHLRKKALAMLPFELTDGQKQAIADIDADMAAPIRMLRLLQGDVGAGKTLVAFMALLSAIEAGHQGALMAPTEILARQHLATLTPLAEACGIRIDLLTGRERSGRAARLEPLASGETDLIIGTHALFTDNVVFHDLGLAVVDEQHRFGVHQRLALQEKGKTDVLVMTATPIPRTLALTAYGDMEVTRLTGRPPGRQPVDTRVINAERLDEVIGHLGRAIQGGARAYWVCPLVEESEKLDLAAAEQRAAELERALGPVVALAHGKMKAAERDQAMAEFKDGSKKLLVATTVIEVGVDVPEATIMVIEHAERFGLAQLHQLRGRVGRGSGKSTCLLIYQGPLGKTAQERLKTLRDTDDGFVIAEADLKLRGPGEMLGTRQSGEIAYRMADLAAHADLLAAARDDTKLILTQDPDLKGERGCALRTLLYLFGRDQAVKYLRAG